MRIFKIFRVGAIFGLLLTLIGSFWQVIRNLGTADFILRKLGLEEQMKPVFTAIASWPWFPALLSIVGLIWILFSVLPKKERYIPLTTVVERLIQKGTEQGHIKEYGYAMEIHNDSDSYYESFAKLISEYVDIFGKKSSSTSFEWEKIPKDIINIVDIKKLASELYLTSALYHNYGNEPQYIDLALENYGIGRTIKRILSNNRPSPWMSYEVKD